MGNSQMRLQQFHSKEKFGSSQTKIVKSDFTCLDKEDCPWEGGEC
jgi:hypothetical protein